MCTKPAAKLSVNTSLTLTCALLQNHTVWQRLLCLFSWNSANICKNKHRHKFLLKGLEIKDRVCISQYWPAWCICVFWREKKWLFSSSIDSSFDMQLYIYLTVLNERATSKWETKHTSEGFFCVFWEVYVCTSTNWGYKNCTFFSKTGRNVSSILW